MNNKEKKEKAIMFFKGSIEYLKKTLAGMPDDRQLAIVCQNEIDHITTAIEALERKPEISVLYEMKAEIADLAYEDPSEDYEYGYNDGLVKAMSIIDKYNTLILYGLGDFEPEKTGHWLMANDYYTDSYSNIDYFECSCCHKESREKGSYCPNCGAKMTEGKE